MAYLDVALIDIFIYALDNYIRDVENVFGVCSGVYEDLKL